MLSVDENTPMSAIPNTGTWYSGPVNCTKYFDISIAGKCETGSSDRVKLDVQPASEIPSFFTKNKAGKIVFAEPQVVGTVKAAKGHNSWVKVELKTVNGDLTSSVAKHVCLGIKRTGKSDFLDIIHAGNLTSKYVNVVREDSIDLVPLLSKTATTASTKYVAVTPGSEVAFTDITVPTTGEFNFNSVYRVNVSSIQTIGTIKAARGRNSWVQIKLESVSGSTTSDAAKHVYLGIKKSDEDDFFDVIYSENLTSRYIDVTQDSYIELIPLPNKTATTINEGIDEAMSSVNTTLPTTGSFNFCSLYKLNISVHNGQWLTDQTCNLNSISGNTCDNYGRMGVGPVTDQSGKVHENQLFAISYSSKLVYSSDGAHWTENGSVKDSYWYISPVYGNGIWCVVANNVYGVRRSTDGGKSWSGDLDYIGTECLNFANGVFMTVTYIGNPEIVYTSPDAEIWTKAGSVKFTAGCSCILIYGAGKWICGSGGGYVCQSKDNGKTWEQISDGLMQISVKDNVNYHSWYGGCYVNGYFYVIRDDGLIARSLDGVEWKKVFSFDGGNSHYYNITYYKNKLWAFDGYGKKYVVGLFNPDGTIESLE